MARAMPLNFFDMANIVLVYKKSFKLIMTLFF